MSCFGAEERSGECGSKVIIIRAANGANRPLAAPDSRSNEVEHSTDFTVKGCERWGSLRACVNGQSLTTDYTRRYGCRGSRIGASDLTVNIQNARTMHFCRRRSSKKF